MSWDFFPDTYMQYLGDGKILLHTLHLSDENSSNLSGTRIPNILMFSIDDIRESTNTTEIVKDETLTLYPIPVSLELEIKSSKSTYVTYEIVDGLGQYIQGGNIANNRINVQRLSDGYYTVKLFDINNHNSPCKKWKKN